MFLKLVAAKVCALRMFLVPHWLIYFIHNLHQSGKGHDMKKMNKWIWYSFIHLIHVVSFVSVVCWFIRSRHLIIQPRHDDHDDASNHQPHGCLLNRLFGRRSKKTSKFRATGLCVGNSPGPVNSPHKGPVTRKCFHLMTSSCSPKDLAKISPDLSDMSRRRRYLYSGSMRSDNVVAERAFIPEDSVLEERTITVKNHVIKWKHFPRYWSFMRGIHRWPANSPLKGQWCIALMFSFICTWINGWVNNGEAGDLRRHRAHYDVIVMWTKLNEIWYHSSKC